MSRGLWGEGLRRDCLVVRACAWDGTKGSGMEDGGSVMEVELHTRKWLKRQLLCSASLTTMKMRRERREGRVRPWSREAGEQAG